MVKSVIFATVLLVFGGIIGYVIGSKLVTKNAVTPKASNGLINQVTYLSKISPSQDKGVVFIAKKDDVEESLNVADSNLTPSSVKMIYKIDLPGALGFRPPVYFENDYIIASMVGADANDILISTADGVLVTKSVRDSNPELSSWILNYDGVVVKSGVIGVSLFKIDNSKAYVHVSLSTGKAIPNSLVITK